MCDVRLDVCSCCDGEGRVYERVWVYERGCGFAHEDDADVGPCDECDGTGGALVPVEPVELEDVSEFLTPATGDPNGV